MNKKKNLGKIVGNVLGYNVRIMLESKTSETQGRDDKVIRTSTMADSGKFGVYAGRKKLVQGEFASKQEAMFYALDLSLKK